MDFLKRIFSRAQTQKRLFVLSLDGFSLEMADWAAATQVMPHMASLFNKGAIIPLNGILPAVNQVTWASYATGVNPGKHGVFGFVDREPSPFGVHIPGSEDVKAPALWDYLGKAGKRIGLVNLPLTYPPRAVNGFMVSCSMSPDLAKATFPVELAPRLMEMDYRLEADASAMGPDEESAPAFMDQVNQVMAQRFSSSFQLIKSEAWDFFQLHISGGDLLNYFFWPEDRTHGFSEDFLTFYRRLDSYIGELAGLLPQGSALAILSGGGFDEVKLDVYLNHWLEENGYLMFGRGQRSLASMHADSKAYSLVPGRIYINLEGREERGGVTPGGDYEELREELAHRLGGLSDPESGKPVIRAIHRREDLYDGPMLGLAADLIVEPEPGYDLKANLDGSGVFTRPELPGMHSGGGGFLFMPGVKAADPEGVATIMEAAPTFLKFLDVEIPPGLDGRSLI